MGKAKNTLFTVTRAPGEHSKGVLHSFGAAIPVALGRSGIKADKREGDGGTPRGRFRLLRLWWRPDRMPRPRTALPMRRIGRDDAWCEDASDHRYNQPFHLAPGAPGDRLWREDHLYDLIIELDHNTRPRAKNRGSAVFIHLARTGFQPTAGCIALRGDDLRRLLPRLRKNSWIEIR